MEGRCERRDDGWWLMVPGGGCQSVTGVGPFPCQAAAEQAARLVNLHAALASAGQPQEEVQRLQAELEVSSGTLPPPPPPPLPAVRRPCPLRWWWPTSEQHGTSLSSCALSSAQDTYCTISLHYSHSAASSAVQHPHG